jgi:hypothetical protein
MIIRSPVLVAHSFATQGIRSCKKVVTKSGCLSELSVQVLLPGFGWRARKRRNPGCGAIQYVGEEERWGEKMSDRLDLAPHQEALDLYTLTET